MEMTENDKKKEFLRRYRECERREQEILEEIQRLRADKMFPSSVNDGMPKGSQQSDLSDYMVLLDEQRVLRLRYLWGLGWIAVGRRMGYSREGAIKIHGRALQNLKIC